MPIKKTPLQERIQAGNVWVYNSSFNLQFPRANLQLLIEDMAHRIIDLENEVYKLKKKLNPYGR